MKLITLSEVLSALLFCVALPISTAVSGSLEFTNHNWLVTQHGDLSKGEILRIAHDNGRMPDCRGTYHGLPAWGVIANVIFHPGGQKPPAQNVARGAVASFAIPADAEQVEVWFILGGRCSMLYYDSNFGHNFWFPVN